MTGGATAGYVPGVLSAAATFLRLWLIFAFSYAILIVVYDLAVRGYVDISIGPRGRELLFVPLIETALFALLTRDWRRRRSDG